MTEIRAKSVMVVSGGAKGITARCVEALAEAFRCNFILLGRSALAAEPAWAQGLTDEAALKKAAMGHLQASGEKPTPAAVNQLSRGVQSSREIQATLDNVAAKGGQAVYISADITDAEAVRQAIAQGEAAMGPVTCIMHGAGNLADKLIENKTQKDFETVYAAKVQGLENLLAAVPADRISHLVLFASVAGFYGNIGQADYAIANEVLNTAAHLFKRQHPGAHVVSVNWGPWDAGMVTPQLKAYFEQHNIQVIPIEVGAQMLVEELAGMPGDDAVEIVVGSGITPQAAPLDPTLRTYQVRRKLVLEASPFLQDHVVDGKAVLPMVSAFSWMCNVAAGLYPGYVAFSFEDYRVLKGVVFDENLADEFLVEVSDVDKREDQIVVDITVSSQPPGSRLPRYHYSARLTLVRQKPAAPTIQVDLSPRQNLPGRMFYEDYTLFHGYAFQGVDRVLNISDGLVTMQCHVPVVAPHYQGQFPVTEFNYFMTDIGLQSMGIYAKHRFGAGSLPLRSGSGEHFMDAPWGGEFYVTLHIHQAAPTGLVTTIYLHDATGKVYQIVRDSEITISKNLNALFRRNRLPAPLA